MSSWPRACPFLRLCELLPPWACRLRQWPCDARPRDGRGRHQRLRAAPDVRVRRDDRPQDPDSRCTCRTHWPGRKLRSGAPSSASMRRRHVRFLASCSVIVSSSCPSVARDGLAITSPAKEQSSDCSQDLCPSWQLSTREAVASPSIPSWNQIAAFLQSMQRLRDSVGFAA